MKRFIIKQIDNGWIITDDVQTHAFQTVPQLQQALPGLLGDAPKWEGETTKLTAEQCLESHKKAVEEFEGKNKPPGWTLPAGG
jgi:hypothetical protein